MKTCTIDYINNAELKPSLSTDLNDTHKQLLEGVHLDIMREIASAEYIKDGDTEKKKLLFGDSIYLHGKQFKVLSSFSKDKAITQEDFILKLNRRIKKEIADEGVFFSIPAYNPVRVVSVEIYKDKPKLQFIIVDLLPYLENKDSLLTEEFLSDPANIDKALEYMNSNYYNPSWINKAESLIETFVNAEKDNPGETLLTEELHTMLEKIETYISNIVNNPNKFSEFPEGVQERLKNTFYSLQSSKKEFDDLKEAGVEKSVLSSKAVQRVYLLTKYIQNSYSTVKTLEARFRDSVDPMLKGINDFNIESYNQDVYTLGNTLQEMKYLMEAIAPIEDILSGISQGSNFNFWELYNINKIENLVGETFIGDQDKYDGIASFLTGREETLDSVYVQMQQQTLPDGSSLYTSEDIAKVKGIIEDSRIHGKDYLQEAFNNFNNLFVEMRSKIKESHYNYTATVLFNQQLKSYGVESLDDVPEKDRKRLLTKAQIIAELKIASTDIDIANQYFAIDEHLDDAVMRLYFDLLNTPLRLNIIKNAEDRADAESLIKKLNLDLKDDSSKRKNLEQQFIQEITYVASNSRMIEADQDWIDSGLPTLTAFGTTFQAQKGQAYIEEYNMQDYVFQQKAHYATLNKRTRSVLDLISFDMSNPKYFKETPTGQLAEDLQLLEKAKYLELKKEINGDLFIKLTSLGISSVFDSNTIKQVLNKNFYENHSEYKSSKDIKEKLKKEFNIDSLDDALAQLNNDSSKFYSYFTKNSIEKDFSSSFYYDKKTKTEVLSQYLQNGNLGAFMSLDKTIVKTSEGKYIYFEDLEEAAAGKYRDKKTKEVVTVDTIALLIKDFQQPTAKYKNSKFTNLKNLKNSDFVAAQYHDFLYKNYQEANKRIDAFGLEFGLLPKIAKSEAMDLIDRIKKTFTKEGWNELYESFKYKDPDVTVINDKAIKRQEGEFIFRQLNPKYVQELSPDVEQLTDLFIVNSLFSESSRSYEALATAEPTAKVLRTLLTGNDILTINARTAKEKKNNNWLFSTINQFFKKSHLRSTQAFLSLIDSKIYGYKNDYEILGMSSRQVVSLTKQVVAFQVLANNVKAGITNIGMGTGENFVAAAGKRFGIDDKILRDAYKEYSVNIAKYIGDEFKKNISEMSLHTQLMVTFDAIKGNLENGRESIDPHYWQKKWVTRATYYTQSLPEHLNQGALFLALYNTFEIAGGVNGKPAMKLKDIVEHTPGQPFTFNLYKLNDRRRELGLKEFSQKEFDDQVKVKFSKRLSKILSETQGYYDQINKTVIEDEVFLSMAYMFQRWMYPGFRAKWGFGGKYLPSTGEFEQEGYLRTFAINMVKEADKTMVNVEDYSMYLRMRDIIKTKNIKNVGQIVSNLVLKGGLGSIAKLSMNLFGIKSPKFEDWLFGEKADQMEDEVYNRLNRAYRYIGIWQGLIAAMWMLRGMAEAIKDDDEDNGLVKMLKMFELQSMRISSDMGFFLNPFTLADKMIMKYRDPLTIWRSYDSTSGFLKQMLWYEVNPDEDNFINWTFNDTYERSGPGYEKGDYKAWVKFRKTFLSPINQYIKLMNPEEEIKYMNMIFNN